MARIIINNKELEIADNTAILETCEEAGVPFGCQQGQCGTCQIQIEEGEDNLAELTQEEQDMAMDHKNRLACQCIIKSGTVKITY